MSPLPSPPQRPVPLDQLPPPAGPPLDLAAPVGAPLSTRPPASAAAVVHWSSDGPPPPRSAHDPARSRSTAAAWVAATGALLLLVAAATFLAVSWDLLPLSARIGIVAAMTGTALLGGHRVRVRTPAVGTVVYHLGALLIPVDVLGLALHLEVDRAPTWALVGATAVVVLPPLAEVGRSRLLAWGGFAGIPVFATGVGAWVMTAGGWGAITTAAPVLVGVSAAVVLALTQIADRASPVSASPVSASPVAAVARLATPVLAVLAVAGALLLTVASRFLGADVDTTLAFRSGWVATGWELAAVVTLVAVGVLLAAASRHRSAREVLSRRVAGAVPLTIVMGAGLAVLPVGTTRTVLLIVPAAAVLVVELAALAVARDEAWSRPLATGAVLVEVVVAAQLTPLAVVLAAGGADLVLGEVGRSEVGRSVFGRDPALAAMLAIVGLAWASAAARQLLVARGRRVSPVVLTVLAGAHVVASLAVVGADRSMTALALVMVAVALLAWVPFGAGWARTPGSATSTPRPISPNWPPAASVAGWSAAGLFATSLLAAGGTASSHAVVLLAAVTLGLVLAAAGAARPVSTAIVHGLRGVAVVLVVLPALATPSPAGGRLVAVAVSVVGLLVLTLARDDDGADVLRAVAYLGVPLVVLPGMADAGWLGRTGPLGREVLALFGVTPDAWWLAAGVLVWVVVDTVRLRRGRLAAFGAAVAVQAIASVALATGVPIDVVGVLLVATALAAGVGAVLLPRAWTAAALTVALLAGPVGWALIVDRPALRAAVTIALGLAVAGAAAWRRRPVLAHLGGVVAVLGAWQLAAVAELTAIDVWLAPVALHWWVAGIAARRRGASSWVTDVPPLLLVAVPAVLERVAGGPGWHSLLAGAMAVIAVAVGGLVRLGGPLVVGSVVLATVVVVEVVLVVAGVPTWVWLGVAGGGLLVVAALIERSGGSPVEAARGAVGRFRQRWA